MPDIKIAPFDLGETGKVLIEKLSAGVGNVFAPFIARQQAKAAKTETESEIANRQLAERAKNRFVRQELRKQQNLESIAGKAERELPKGVGAEQVQNLDEDWATYFAKYCDTVSNETMQSLWAKMLAVEVTKPRSFSRQTISIVSQMEAKDAQLFNDFCQFVWDEFDLREREKFIHSLIYDITNSVYTNQGINFSATQHLEAIGLLQYHPVDYPYEKGFIPLFHYHGTIVQLKNLPLDNKIGQQKMSAGSVSLTRFGAQLFNICKPVRNEEFFHYVMKKWEKMGYQTKLVSPTARLSGIHG